MQTLLNFLSSVALLVWGTHIVRTGVLRVFGADLRRILARSVASRPRAFLAGVGVTCLVQSSNATALMVSSFVGHGLIALAPALVIMLGANVGTAIMTQVFSLDLSWLSPLCILFGVIFFLSRRDTRAGQLGRVAIGLGLILLALELIMAATAPITGGSVVRSVFAALSGDQSLAVVVGAAIAIASFSSLAIVLIAAALAASSVLTVPMAFAIVMGANLGSALLASVASLRAEAGGRYVAVGNLLFKVAACLVFTLALPWVIDAVRAVDLDPRREVVHFHVLFNLVTALAFIGFTDPIARAIERWMPRPAEGDLQAKPRFLDPADLATPALALSNAAREVLRIGDIVERMLGGLMELIRGNDASRANQLIRLDDDVDSLYTAVKLYLAQVSREQLDERDSQRWSEIISLTINLEHVGDILEQLLGDLRDKKIAKRLTFSEAGMKEMDELHAKLVESLRLGLAVFLNGDVAMAQRLLAQKERFGQLEREYHETHLARLAGQSAQSIETSALHLDVISDMRRMNSFLCSTAYPILERAGKLRKTRLVGTATGAYRRPDQPGEPAES